MYIQVTPVAGSSTVFAKLCNVSSKGKIKLLTRLILISLRSLKPYEVID